MNCVSVPWGYIASIARSSRHIDGEDPAALPSPRRMNVDDGESRQKRVSAAAMETSPRSKVACPSPPADPTAAQLQRGPSPLDKIDTNETFRGASHSVAILEELCKVMSLNTGLPLVLVGKIACRSGGSDNDCRWAETFLKDPYCQNILRKHCSINQITFAGDECQFEASVAGNRIRRRLKYLHAAFVLWVSPPVRRRARPRR